MTTRYPGGLIRKTPPTVTPPVGGVGGSAPGVWTLEQASYYTKTGSWPKNPPIRELWAWGTNNKGQVGSGNVVNYSSPVQIGTDTNWSIVAARWENTFAIKTTGTLWAWGDNGFGQLGVGNDLNRSSPTQVGALTTWAKAATMQGASCAIKTDGTLWACGNNTWGAIGVNNAINYSSPVQIGTGTNWENVWGGRDFFIATRTDGTLWAWGRNSYGELGTGSSTVPRSSPTQIGAGNSWAYANCGDYFTFAITTDGFLFSTGYNATGELAQNTVTNLNTLTQVGLLNNWFRVACGGNFGLATKTNGTLWAWGDNASGCLGLNLGTTTYRSSPVQVGTLTNWNFIAAGTARSLAIKNDNSAWYWGNNGLTNAYSSPVQLGTNVWGYGSYGTASGFIITAKS